MTEQHTAAKRPIEEIEAGDKYRQMQLAHADRWDHNIPLWHGWVIMDAFLAGIDYARKQPADNGEELARRDK